MVTTKRSLLMSGSISQRMAFRKLHRVEDGDLSCRMVNRCVHLLHTCPPRAAIMRSLTLLRHPHLLESSLNIIVRNGGSALITATLLCVQSPSRVDTSCGLGIDTPCRVFAPDCSSARLALLTHAQAEAAEEPKITGSQRAGHGFPHSIVPSALNRDGVMHEQ